MRHPSRKLSQPPNLQHVCRADAEESTRGEQIAPCFPFAITPANAFNEMEVKGATAVDVSLGLSIGWMCVLISIRALELLWFIPVHLSLLQALRSGWTTQIGVWTSLLLHAQ